MNNVPQREPIVIPPPAVIALDLLRYERLHDELTANIQSIQAQLSDMDKRDADGERMSEHAWHAWRKRATFALQCRLREKRELKTALPYARRIALSNGTLSNPVEDMPAFRAGLVGKIATLLTSLQTLRGACALDDDGEDLIGCLVENLGELRDMLPHLAERDQVAS